MILDERRILEYKGCIIDLVCLGPWYKEGESFLLYPIEIQLPKDARVINFREPPPAIRFFTEKENPFMWSFLASALSVMPEES